jgi:Cu-Zn family superoxide dismutase
MRTETVFTALKTTFELPGDAAFPESVGVDESTGHAYVGSLADGTVYRLAPDGDVEVWSDAGADGRGSVAGVKVDAQQRLWAAGGYDGSVRVYDLASRSLLCSFDVGARPACVNDIAFGPDGAAYVTDSLISVLFRVDADTLVLEPWVDLAEQGVPWSAGLNLNGIVLAPDGGHLVACQTNLGRFWNVELGSGRVTEVAIDGGPLEHSDGLALSGSTLYAAVNARNEIAVIDLADDGSSAHVRMVIKSAAFAFPTAVAQRPDDLLVVNSQLDRMGGTPRLPFTVIAIAAPEGSA